MRYNDIYLAGAASWLAPREPVGQDRYEPGEQDEHAYESVSVAGPDQAPPDMAVRAGRLALARSGIDAAQVSLLLHASIWYQGLDMWAPSAYIQHALLGENRTAHALDICQMCAGIVSGLQLAADHLIADPARTAAVITTADRFAPPTIDRWHVEGGKIIYGDGAGALVLARSRGFARLLAARTVADTNLEPMNRGDDPLTAFSPSAQHPVDNQARRTAFFTRNDPHQAIARINSGMAEAVHGLLDETGLTITDVSRFIFPNVGLDMLTDFIKPFGIDVSQTTWELGRTTGHVGAADPITGLTYLLEQQQLTPGDRVMLVTVGFGFYWACALLECTDTPCWPPVP